jgi:hypothetical protein
MIKEEDFLEEPILSLLICDIFENFPHDKRTLEYKFSFLDYIIK